MPWIRFTGDWLFHARPSGATVAYKAGMRCHVVQAAADEVIAAGVGEAMPRPSKALAKRLAADPFAADGADGEATEAADSDDET